MVLAAKVLRRELLARAGLAHLILDRYPYAFTPAQLWFVCAQLDEVTEIDGAVVEIGCGWGATTVYLNRHLAATGTPRAYHCVDTFSGFTPADVAVERQRGKLDAYDDFSFNSRRLFEMTMATNGIADRVVVHQADVSSFDFTRLPAIALALVDVDLRLPMGAALEGVWSKLSPGGVIVVDDCAPGNKWDGALQAYEEFCRAHELDATVHHHKLGLMTKGRPPRP